MHRQQAVIRANCDRWLGQLFQWSCGSRGMARKLLLVHPDWPWSTSSKKYICVQSERQQECEHQWMFSQRWPAHYINIKCIWTILTSSFCHHLTSLWGYHHLPGARVTIHQNATYREVVVISFYHTHDKLCHNAWELLTTHTPKSNNPLLIPQTR